MPETLSAYLAAEKQTQEEFATLIGADQSTVSRWLAGRVPRQSHLKKIREVTKGRVTLASWDEPFVQAAGAEQVANADEAAA